MPKQKSWNGEFLGCDVCGQLIYVPIPQMMRSKYHYCGYECYNKGRTLYNVGEYSARWNGGDIEFECEHCHKKFYEAQNRRLGKHIYCSLVCMGLARIGKAKSNSLNWKSKKETHNCYDCGKKISHYKRLNKVTNKYFCSSDCAYKHVYPHSRFKYNKRSFRSNWEANFAKWCDGSGIKWEYENKRFDLGNTTYTPDFYLPEFDYYIEVKGYWRDDAKQKMKRFKIQYPTVNIKILDEQKLHEYGVI